MYPSTTVQEFTKRLNQAEATGDVEALAQLFTDNAALTNLTRHNTHTRRSESSHTAREYWHQYLHAFEEVDSQFVRITDTGEMAILEWHSTGHLRMGLPIEYNGVSIIEYKDEKILAFRTYYDSAAFLPHASYGKPYSDTVGVPEITNQATS